MRRRRGAALLVAAALAVAAGGGCGGAIAPDLFEVIRSPTGPGSGPDAALDLVVSDDGGARCDRGPRRRMPDELVIAARTLQMDIDRDVLRHAALSQPPGGVYAYRIRDQDGDASFSDTSPGLPVELQRVAGFTLQVAQRVCGRAH